MPQFYFNVRDGSEVFRDPVGSECQSLDDAKADAKIAAREFVVEALRFERPVDGRVIEITDENGKVLAEIPFRDIVNPP
ncbi:MAG TPA: hypothetical protein VHW02_08815 [Rhizomicrobium sp.]|jgi:hypothetical protein|nr:hypothetical protein [Rhizomicrobium sp.]